jgi:hypothetical protein
MSILHYFLNKCRTQLLVQGDYLNTNFTPDFGTGSIQSDPNTCRSWKKYISRYHGSTIKRNRQPHQLTCGINLTTHGALMQLRLTSSLTGITIHREGTIQTMVIFIVR